MRFRAPTVYFTPEGPDGVSRGYLTDPYVWDLPTCRWLKPCVGRSGYPVSEFNLLITRDGSWAQLTTGNGGGTRHRWFSPAADAIPAARKWVRSRYRIVLPGGPTPRPTRR